MKIEVAAVSTGPFYIELKDFCRIVHSSQFTRILEVRTQNCSDGCRVVVVKFHDGTEWHSIRVGIREQQALIEKIKALMTMFGNATFIKPE